MNNNFDNNFVIFVLIAFIISCVITLLIKSTVLKMIEHAGFVRPNFNNDPIPVGSGVIFSLSAVLSIIPFVFVWPEPHLVKAFIFLFVITFTTFLGLMDDFWGSRETSGLRGHIGSLLKGHLTTGGLKALWGGMLALLVAIVSGPLEMVPVNALLLALFINAVNLLDLRPGRAGKVFIVFAIIMVVAGWGRYETVFLIMLIGSVVAFLPLDLKARTMMGDAGANTLGAGLGIIAVWIFEPFTKIVFLFGLFLFHFIAEKYSLTRLIAGNRILNFLDTLGREK